MKLWTYEVDDLQVATIGRYYKDAGETETHYWRVMNHHYYKVSPALLDKTFVTITPIYAISKTPIPKWRHVFQEVPKSVWAEFCAQRLGE